VTRDCISSYGDLYTGAHAGDSKDRIGALFAETLKTTRQAKKNDTSSLDMTYSNSRIRNWPGFAEVVAPM